MNDLEKLKEILERVMSLHLLDEGIEGGVRGSVHFFSGDAKPYYGDDLSQLIDRIYNVVII